MIFRLFSISDEGRSTMTRWREGLTADQFADAMWARREAEHGQAMKASEGWPFVRQIDKSGNVTPIRKARGGK